MKTSCFSVFMLFIFLLLLSLAAYEGILTAAAICAILIVSFIAAITVFLAIVIIFYVAIAIPVTLLSRTLKVKAAKTSKNEELSF